MECYTCSWIKKNHLCQKDYTTQNNLQIQPNSCQITNGVCHRTREKIKLKFVWRHKRPWIAKAILRKASGTGEIRLPDYMLHKTTEIKTVWRWQPRKRIDQWNKRQSPETHIHTYSRLTYSRGGKITQQNKDSLCHKWPWENRAATFKKRNLNHSLTPYTKINSEWVRLKCETSHYKTLRGKHR